MASDSTPEKGLASDPTPKKVLLDVLRLLTVRAPKKVELPEIHQLDEKDRTLSVDESITVRLNDAIKFASIVPRSANFQSFNELHQDCSASLTNVFLDIPLPNDLYNAVAYAKTHVNVHIVNYALAVALNHRTDALQNNILLPSNFHVNPGNYVSLGQIIKDLHDGNFMVRKDSDGNTIGNYLPLPQNLGFFLTATDRDLEHKVAYFREDLGVNLHHRHWHEVYPFGGHRDSVIKKDRRGELFNFMHEQILARYNFERLSTGLARVEPLNLRESIPEAYFPKLQNISNASRWGARPANLVLKDIHRDGRNVEVEKMEHWVQRINNAIDLGYALIYDQDTDSVYDKKISIKTGIDELGSTVEAASILSWNYRYYGNLHNTGHMMISAVHDPDYRFEEPLGVMSDNTTAMRDPLFYRWHSYIDNIFQNYKRTLPQYTLEEKQFKDVSVNSVEVISELLHQDPNKDVDPLEKNNIFHTFWEKDAVEINPALPTHPTIKTPIYVIFYHLQHRKFKYHIKVSNTRNTSVKGTVRIFMAPKCAENGEKLDFHLHRLLFIELDKFTVDIPASTDDYLITRLSVESSVTIPFERIFNKQEQTNHPDPYCGCGWPQYMLIGRGSAGEGLLCDLFVMITDYKDDKVVDSPIPSICQKSPISYCGLRNKKYPDKKPMGFPFDRDYKKKGEDPSTNPTKIEDFVKGLSNVALTTVRVRHTKYVDEAHIPWGESGGNPKHNNELEEYQRE